MHQADEITSEKIAHSLLTDPTMVRRIMARLKKAGLLNSVRGIAKPQITRSYDEITLKDIYYAVSTAPAFLNVDYQTSSTCSVGSKVPTTLAKYYQQIQEQAEDKMAQISLATIISDIKDK